MNRLRPLVLSAACVTACGAASSLEGGAGGAGAGGADAGTCSSGTVTFRVNQAPGATAPWCLGQPGSCSSAWLNIRNSAGELLLSNACSTPCDTCTPLGCPAICAMPLELAAQGVSQNWNGTYYVADHCGPGSSGCLNPRCAAPGQYTAVVCGFLNPYPDGGFGCASATNAGPICREQPFTYPSNTPIVVTMPG